MNLNIESKTESELLIVSVTPQNLERDVLWFEKNRDAIKKAKYNNPWWSNNSIILEQNLTIKPSTLIRNFTDLGYERTQNVIGAGLFAPRGGVIEIWPINSEKPYLIEFAGNSISLIQPRQNPPIDRESKTLHKIISKQDIKNLSPGSYIVHEDHGIGILRDTIKETELQGALTPSLQYFVVEYAPQAPGRIPDRLYVPLYQEKRLTPYVGFEKPKIHRLGGNIWQKTKKTVREDVEKLARKLLSLYAERSLSKREPHIGDSILEGELRNTFAYQETPDQIKSEKEILADLEKKQPMQRILCGDVGFGKTELAIRAALRVITSGKQVAVLAPTTILANQHLNTFNDRFQNLPVKIGMLSRLTPKKEEKDTIQKIEQGAVDCILGTHRLLSKDVKFKNLGMVIIDEEQKFGVWQKERLKEICVNADILYLSATPIPRTLSMTLAKLHDISFLEMPPPERLAIKTFVTPYNKNIIAESIRRELKRDGQVYFLHNRIETLRHIKEKIVKILSKDKTTHMPAIEIIHGRMKEKEIIYIMNKFRNKEIQILVATTIIENGLDISSANTLIVDDATRLGLADMHQLRGRIGRGEKQAYAYFFYNPRRVGQKAQERLEAIQEFADLGSGFNLALKDLELRGAGNILGKEQSGAINKVGLNLYCQMLTEATEMIKEKGSWQTPTAYSL